ncbi:MAG TPA: glycosyltransferase [Acidimicrobiia bacterium]|nr:glycosyltransferase [Acidimicrobiia bacterium]
MTASELPTCSVVIAAYQAAHVIGDAVASALGQTRPPLEIIICNDGSTDDLHAALTPYADRVMIIDQPNMGEAGAKNRAAAAASGDLIAFLDADDVFLPRRLEAVSALAAAHRGHDLFTTDAYLVVDRARVRHCFTDDFQFEAVNQRAAILERNFLPFAVVRRSAFMRVGGFDETLRDVPDWELWMRLILDGATAGFINEPLAEYRVGLRNVTASRVRLYRGKIVVLERAQARADLSPEERALIAHRLRDARRDLTLHMARDAVRNANNARHACGQLLLTPGVSLTARVNALAGLIAPGWARRALLRREQLHGVEVTAGLRIAPL